MIMLYCVKSAQITEFFLVSVFSLTMEKCGPDKTRYLDTFHAVLVLIIILIMIENYVFRLQN